MIEKIKTVNAEIIELLTLAVARNKIEKELEDYLKLSYKHLYINWHANVAIGCIGIIVSDENKLVITHLATGKAYQKKKIASNMIDFVTEIHRPSIIIAETDNDSVGFYKNYGFQICSLGEKYPNVERFECVYSVNG